jgi:P27 family predicted phage terminase small subunit
MEPLPMGARGPQPTPTAIKKVLGNPGKRPLNTDELKPVGSLKRPTHIKGGAAEEWDRVIGAMPTGFYTAADVPVLAMYVEALVIYRNATSIVARDGMEAVGSTGQKIAHPQLAVMARFADLMTKLADRLGMSPAARTKFTAPGDDSQDDLDARYFGRPN